MVQGVVRATVYVESAFGATGRDTVDVFLERPLPPRSPLGG